VVSMRVLPCCNVGDRYEQAHDIATAIALKRAMVSAVLR
jgi:hypothetical protein